jgi:rhodanese-related sulfurtransferase
MKLYQQVLYILLLATAIGITMNVVRSNSLPWFAREIETAAADAAEVDLLLRNSSETTALRSVTLQQAYEFFKQRKATFIDAREPAEYTAGHIPGAVNIPMDFIYDEQYGNLLKQMRFDEPLVVYCPGVDCDLAKRAAEELRYRGFQRVFVFDGGFNEWSQAGYPIERSATDPN